MSDLSGIGSRNACGAHAALKCCVRFGYALISFAVAIVIGLHPGPAPAQELKVAVADLLDNHKRVKASQQELQAAREKARVALKDWFPDFSVTANYGYERQKKGQGAQDSYMPPREIDLKITQLLWDFGAANASIEKARLTFEQAQATLSLTQQSVLLEAITAYLDVLKAVKVLDFARGSEANIKRQTELEDARVRRGSGLSTDVLQSKTQLAGAQSRRVDAEGTLKTARNKFRAVFGYELTNLKELAPPRVPLDRLPPKIEDAVESAFKNNPQLKAAKLAGDIARADIGKTRADEFLPTLNLTGESKHKQDVDGTIGGKTEQVVKVELTYKFDMGFTAVNSLRAAEQTAFAVDNRYGDARDQIEEQVRNAWENLGTAKEKLDHLRNQADISAEFLELARKERSLGTRSLIDVLSGETSLINASSDAAAAETDVAVAVFKLLNAMGQLDVSSVE